jgi:DNA-binding CsgD family transcriptional regulator
MVLAKGSTEVSEMVDNEHAQTPFALFRGKDLPDEVSNLLEVLDDRERKIIFQRFALNGGKSKTLEEVAKKFGFTRKRIRQLQNIALAKLRLRIQSDPILHRLLVVFVTGLVLRINECQADHFPAVNPRDRRLSIQNRSEEIARQIAELTPNARAARS